jgi:hypothetical protein
MQQLHGTNSLNYFSGELVAKKKVFYSKLVVEVAFLTNSLQY